MRYEHNLSTGEVLELPDLEPTPQPPAPPPSIQSQIDALDGGDPMARPTREFLLLSMEEKALAAGYTLEQLRASQFGYRKVKELDEQVAALRAQL